jgi:hypothetical protein
MQGSESVLSPAAELPRTFLRSAAEHLAILREALLFDDKDRACMTARSLKRLCGGLAWCPMKSLAAELERRGATDPAEAISLLRALDIELDGLRRSVV